MLDIYIVSRGRPNRCLTLGNLKDLSPYGYKIKLVVHQSEADLYAQVAKMHNAELMPLEYNGIADKRRQIAQQAGEKFVMLDDDMKFFRLVAPDDWHLRQIKQGEQKNIFNLLEQKLDEYAHVSVCAREGHNRNIEKAQAQGKLYMENTRYMRVLGYRKKEYMECEHNRIEFMEDFDINLQLLRKGYPSFVTLEFAQNQPTMQSEGGCSLQRTHETQARAAEKLKELHPDFVDVVLKENKYGNEFKKRKEVRVKWKEAFKSADKGENKQSILF